MKREFIPHAIEGTVVNQQQCARCGMGKQQWQGNGGLGVQKNGETFCCQGCADNTGCTCR